jgi:gamma-glutamyl-gamma-aminobutyrate hydrolase PuuD
MSSKQDKPIIAIISNPYPEDDDTSDISFVVRDYVQWLKELGNNVIILLWNSEKEYIKDLIPRINGLLVQGGGRLLRSGHYEEMLDFIIHEANNHEVPIWFTCQGFEFLHCWLANNYNILGHFTGTREILLSNKIKRDTLKDSKLYKYIDSEDLEICENLNTPAFVHYHSLGVNDRVYDEYPILNDELRVLSTGKDSNGNEFISAVESKDFSKHKYFATQYHPEKARYSTRKENHTEYSCKIAYKVGLGFFDEVLKSQSNQKMTLSKEEFEKHNIHEDFPVTLTGINEKHFFKDGKILETLDLSKFVIH